MSNSLTVCILLRKYADNLYSLFNLALCKALLDASNRNTFRIKYLFCCIVHADWFTIILFMCFMLLISIYIFSSKFLKHLEKLKKKKIKSLQVDISIYSKPGNALLLSIYPLISPAIMESLRIKLKAIS